jgi:hypothetical protein
MWAAIRSASDTAGKHQAIQRAADYADERYGKNADGSRSESWYTAAVARWDQLTRTAGAGEVEPDGEQQPGIAHMTENNKAVCEILVRARLAVTSAADSEIAEMATAVHIRTAAFEAARHTYGVSAAQFARVLGIANDNAHMSVAECVAQMLLDEREVAEQVEQERREHDAFMVEQILKMQSDVDAWPADRISRITAAILHGYSDYAF